MLQRILQIILPVFAIVAAGWLYGRRHRPDTAAVNRMNMDIFVSARPMRPINARNSSSFPGHPDSSNRPLPSRPSRWLLNRQGPRRYGEAVYNALHRMKKFELWGLGPSVTYTEKKRYGQDDIVLMRIKDKQVHTLGMVPCPNLTLHSWE